MTDPGPGIRRLVEEARAGCHDSFSRLVAIHGPSLLSLIRLELGPVLRSRVSADEILQTVLIKAWQSLARFEWQSDAGFYRWLATIAAHTVADEARGHKRDGQTYSLDVLQRSRSWVEIVSPSTASGPREMVREERFWRLQEAFDKLRPEDRRIIILARLRGLPMAEIAAELSCSVPAASMRLLRALRELKAAFGDTGSYHLPPWRLDPGDDGDDDTPPPGWKEGSAP